MYYQEQSDRQVHRQDTTGVGLSKVPTTLTLKWLTSMGGTMAYNKRKITQLLERQLIPNGDRNKEQLLWLTAGKLFSMHATLTDSLTMNIIFNGELASGDSSLSKKRVHQNLSFGFYCKYFPYMENKYVLFEKQIWTPYKAWRTLHSVIDNHPMVMRYKRM